MLSRTTVDPIEVLMTTESYMSWPQICRTERFRGMWVALDNCRYDHVTREPVEGDVVDSDKDLAGLCRRMRETGRTACSILFCAGDVFVEQPAPAPASVRTPPSEPHGLGR
jgi:hypothetical protein